ncbi:MAG TPA: ABC transporter substrate-binding protein [Micromonosporaceae bacterium]|nr:ABC transporter substrate-binding protein [Micromonosporaceae bacterium]
MRPRFPALLAAALSVAVALTGCAAKDGSSSSPEADVSLESATYPVTVGSVTLAKQPVKIVSLSPSATEMLFAIGAGAQVTAVDDNSTFPENAPRTDLSGYQPNAEAVAAKSPDLVVLATDSNKIVDQLTALKVPVYVAPAAKTLDDTYAQIAGLGKLTGHEAEATQVTEQMKSEITEITGTVKKPARTLTFYHELGPEFYSATSKTFIGSVYGLVGLENIADAADPTGAQGGYPQLSAEAIVKANPDLIFLADTKCCKQSAASVQARPGWSGLTAVKNSQVIELDDDVASRWGPRVVELLRTVSGAVTEAKVG